MSAPKKKKELKIGKAPNPKYEKLHQLIHSAPNEFLRNKWKDALAALEKRDREKS